MIRSDRKNGRERVAPGVWRYKDGRELCDETSAGRREYKARKDAMWERQGMKSAISGNGMSRYYCEFDHQAGRGMGGAHRDDRIVLPDGTWINAALNPSENTAKGSKRYHWVDNNTRYVEVVRER